MKPELRVYGGIALIGVVVIALSITVAGNWPLLLGLLHELLASLLASKFVAALLVLCSFAYLTALIVSWMLRRDIEALRQTVERIARQTDCADMEAEEEVGGLSELLKYAESIDQRVVAVSQHIEEIRGDVERRRLAQLLQEAEDLGKKDER